jgi:Mg-chelatase subunit ChlD
VIIHSNNHTGEILQKGDLMCKNRSRSYERTEKNSRSVHTHNKQINNKTTSMRITTYPTNLSLSCTTEYTQLSLNEQEVYMMLSLKAPEYESPDRQGRAPLDLICVIDVSGSMHGDKIELMKKTLLFMVDQLKPMDKCSIVTFDSSINVPLQLMNMDDLNKKKATEVIKKQSAGSCTNLSGGLLKGLEVMRDRKNPSDVTSILLFTDGLANEGITASKDIVEIVQKQLMEYGKHVSLFTFGFGTDHDANMLRAISDAANGLYYYMEGLDQIPQTLSDCLGGLLSILAQNIQLKIETLDEDVQIGKIHSTAYKKNEIKPGREIELSIGDMYSEESRDVVFTATVKAKSSPDYQQLIKASLTYFNVIEKENQQSEVIAGITRVTTPENQTPNPKLDIQRNRVECANTMDSVRYLANDGNFSQAKQLLEDSCTKLQSTHTKDHDFCKGLYADMMDCLDDINDERYTSHGSKKMNTYCSASHHQRSTNDRSSAQRSYLTSHKMDLQSAAMHFTQNTNI